MFRGTHTSGKQVEMENTLTEVKAGGKYVFTFRYSPDLPGYIDALLIRVDTETEDKDDKIIFSPDPALLTEGFDNDEVQKYTSGEKKYRIMAFAELKNSRSRSATTATTCSPARTKAFHSRLPINTTPN